MAQRRDGDWYNDDRDYSVPQMGAMNLPWQLALGGVVVLLVGSYLLQKGGY